MLVYRQKGLGMNVSAPKVPGYLDKKLVSLNESEEVQRQVYDDLKMQIDI